jgi:hypothetical protein
MMHNTNQVSLKTAGLLLFTFFFTIPVYALQTCETAIVETTPNLDFSVHGDGTVTHARTGLMWQVCSQGQTWSGGGCSGTASRHDWQQALQVPSELNVSGGYAGYSDWRLPNINELASIVELKCYSSTINESIFPATGIDFAYWSASPNLSSSSGAWRVRFSDGSVYFNRRTVTNHVRLVRGEE